jgi:predicted SprT family Zn-dependent metalloprotease
MATMLPSLGEKRGKQIIYTVEECAGCGTKTKRSFKEGDYVFKEVGQCQKCNGKLMITLIFSEPIKPNSRPT